MNTAAPIRLAAAILAATAIHAFAADPVVSNVSEVQRPGTKLVDITYDVTADTPTVKVSLRISNDGGTTYSVPAKTFTGDIGVGVTVGQGKRIVWDAAADWYGNYSETMRFEVSADDGVSEGFSLIPGGSFTMGRTSGDTDSNAPPVTVNVSEFYMAKHEVTWKLWKEVRDWARASGKGYTDLPDGAGKADDHPVQTISWWDVVKWCNARSEKDGLTPCYTVNGQVMRSGSTAPECNWSANGYRLPTEAEW